jgi:hypothetical protein
MNAQEQAKHRDAIAQLAVIDPESFATLGTIAALFLEKCQPSPTPPRRPILVKNTYNDLVTKGADAKR